MGGGLFPILDEYKDDISYSNIFHPAMSGISFRYENTEKGSKAKRIYDSIEDYDGDVLGSLADSSYYNLTKKIFPNSKIIQYTNFYDIFAELLLDSNEGCILEKPIVDYFV